LALTPQLTALNDAVVGELLIKHGNLSQVSFGAVSDPLEYFERAVPTTEKPYQDDASYNAARHFKVPMEAITKAAEQLWRHPLSVERDLRIQASGQSGRTVQALRGHVSRTLFRELAKQLITMGYGKSKKSGQRRSRRKAHK